jgi:hypothetical protein
MEASILRFSAFIGAELLFIVVCALAMAPIGVAFLKTGQIKGWHLTAAGVTSSVISVLFLSLFVWILTGRGYFIQFMTILAASLLIMAIVELVWIVFGDQSAPWASRVIWFVTQFKTLFPKSNMVKQAVATSVFLIYPIYIGIGYFGDHNPEQWNGHVLRVTLALLIGIPALLLLPEQLYVMMSRNILEGTRSRLFFSQFLGAVIWLMIVSVFIWTLDPDALFLPIVDQLFGFAPAILYTIGTYVGLALIVPYLIGHFRSKAWVETLEGERFKIVDELLTDANSPSIATANATLVRLGNAIDGSLANFRKDRSFDLTQRVAQGHEKAEPFIAFAARESTERDPRFIHYAGLQKLRSQIDDCVSVLNAKEGDKEQREVLDQFAKAIDLKDRIQQGAMSRPWIVTGFATVATAVVSPFISAISKSFAEAVGIAVG